MKKMKQLIVNGDDFGATQGVNRGIAEVGKNGILTSTSVMVHRPYVKEIADFKKNFPNIGAGVHFEFSDELLSKYNSGEAIAEQEILNVLEEQINTFKKIAGFDPDHMDFHKMAVRRTSIFSTKNIAIFKNPIEKISKKYKLPWRGMAGLTTIDSFHGVIYDPVTHKKLKTDLERISPKALIVTLEQLTDGNYELMAHPGYVDEGTTSSYASEREVEIETLCNPEIAKTIQKLGINLINYSHLPYEK